MPDTPTVNIPSCGDRNQLGTKSLDVDDLKRKRDDKKPSIRDGGKKMCDKMMEGGEVDPYEKGQGPRPDVDEDLIGVKIE
mmetsp:Transcript_31361/g.65632  ORF Transcript_31361/g.65632 Transcript_31361/m.65632 type:complete len:80 (+) Transcript_31361:1366-1605(+)